MSAAPREDLMERAIAAWAGARSEWVDPAQLAEEMGVSVRTVERLVKRRRLPKPLVDEPRLKRWHRVQFLKMVERRERL